MEEGGLAEYALVPVPFGAREEHEEVDSADEADEEVEVVELPPVEVLGEPAAVAMDVGVGRGAVHDDDQQPAEVAGQRQAAEQQRAGDAAHVLRELLVVELHLAHLVERLREAQRRQLRHQGERRRRGHQVGRQRLAVLGGSQHGEPAPALLHEPGDEHGHHGQHHAHAHALQQRDALLAAGEPAQPRQHEPVVERDPHGERQHGEDGEGRRRHLESPRADAAVRLLRLQDDVGGDLRERDVVDDAGGPHGQDAEDALGLLHLLQGAQPPRVPGAAAGVVHLLALGLHHGGLVEERELVRVGQPGHERAGVARPEERRGGVLGRRGAPLACRGHGDADDAGQGHPLGTDAHVEPRAGEEERAGDEHERGGDGEPDPPAHVALHVDDPRGGADHGDGQREVVPVEEAVDAAAAGVGARVELVRAERQAARPDAARAHHDEEEGQRQHRELALRRARALPAAVRAGARRRVQRRHARRQSQDDHALRADVIEGNYILAGVYTSNCSSSNCRLTMSVATQPRQTVA
ncbi:hypothetical protein U9M48_012012 [Paspalum notatum var. saurae]|uniref:Uncharacterized protein n=1 Tax=Paspalum notatum var. saurae TaxID=547442 RepID=A0AAQ3WI94_PASNO